MYGYNTRIYAADGRTVVSLAVLADGDPSWHPEDFRRKYACHT
jgi:hypothetical protein